MRVVPRIILIVRPRIFVYSGTFYFRKFVPEEEIEIVISIAVPIFYYKQMAESHNMRKENALWDL